MGNKEVKYDYCICTFVNENHESLLKIKKHRIQPVLVDDRGLEPRTH